MSCGCWKSPGHIIPPEAAKPSKVLLVILAGSLRQDQDVCVPREQLSVQDSNADGSKDKFPWLGTGFGGSAITWDSLLCLGVKLITALTLPSSNRDVSAKAFSCLLQMLWIIPQKVVRWVLMVFSLCLSGSVLVMTFWPAVRDDNRRIAVATVAAILLLHALLAVGCLVGHCHSFSLICYFLGQVAWEGRMGWSLENLQLKNSLF